MVKNINSFFSGKSIFKIIPMAQDMNEIMVQEITVTTLESFFNSEDTSANLSKFLESTKNLKEQDPPTYFWPTENDPHVQEVIGWAIENAESLFPNLVQEQEKQVT